jgi:hypothetical protein
MSLLALAEKWNQLQTLKTEALSLWTPTSEDIGLNGLVDFQKMMLKLSVSMERVFDDPVIHGKEQEITGLESKLTPDDFRTWNLEKGNRTRLAGEMQSEVCTDKIMKSMGF